MKESIQVNEEEAINITIEHGYDGAEFETSVWKQRGCLKPNRTLEALKSKLETIYNDVEIVGSGKKRQYILSDKKDSVTERIFNYKGSVETEEDTLMKEYIFNKLLRYEEGFTQSYKGWAMVLGFPNTESFSIEDMIYEIKYLHYGFPTIYNPKEVVSKFIQAINTRNKDVIEKSFKRLEKENRISLTEIYNFKTCDDEIEVVDKLEYEEAQEYLRNFLESKGVTLYVYSQSISSINKSKKMRKLSLEVEEFLSEELGIKYFFKSFKVVVLNQKECKEITNDEFIEAYYNRFVKLTTDRQNKEKYKNSILFWQKFYLLNTLTLLDFMKIKGYEENLKNERKLKLEKTDEYAQDFIIYLAEKDVEKETRRHTFGNV